MYPLFITILFACGMTAIAISSSDTSSSFYVGIAPAHRMKEYAEMMAKSSSWFSDLWVPSVGILHNPFQIQKAFSTNLDKIKFLGDSLVGTTAGLIAEVVQSQLSDTRPDISDGRCTAATEVFNLASKRWKYIDYTFALSPTDIVNGACISPDHDPANGASIASTRSTVVISSGLQLATQHVLNSSTIAFTAASISSYEVRMRRAVSCLLAQNKTVLWATNPAVLLPSTKLSSAINTVLVNINKMIRSVCSSSEPGSGGRHGCIVLDLAEVARGRTANEDGLNESTTPTPSVVFKYPVTIAFVQYLGLTLFGSTPRGKVPSQLAPLALMQQKSDDFAHGSWFGNIWIPPGGVFYSPKLIHELWDKYLTMVLFIGDSLGRRLAAAVSSILEKQDPRQFSINHQDLQSHVAQYSHGLVRYKRSAGCRFDFMWSPTNKELQQYVCSDTNSFSDYSHIIINVGIHDLHKHDGGGGTSALNVSVTQALRCLVAKNKFVVWKLIPYATDQAEQKNIQSYNAMTRSACLSEQQKGNTCVTFDTNTVLAHRSFGSDRIKTEDVKSSSHFGPDAHVAQIQYLMNSFFGNPIAPAFNSTW